MESYPKLLKMVRILTSGRISDEDEMWKPGFLHHPADEFMALERSMPGLWKYYHLVMTNSSPWYRWP